MFLKWDPILRRWVVPFAHAHAEKSGEGDGAAAAGTPDPEKKPTDDGTAARLKALEDDNAKLKAEADKRERDSRARKAADDGKLKEELDRANAEREKYATDLKAYEKSTKDRIDRTIAKLPKEQQEEIELIKSDLSLVKLEALVDKRFEAFSKATPADDKEKPKPGDPAKPIAPGTPGVKSDPSKPHQGHEIHAETKEVLKHTFATPQTIEMAKNLGVDSIGKFGWQRTDDEAQNKVNFINLLNSIRAVPIGAPDDSALYGRVLKK